MNPFFFGCFPTSQGGFKKEVQGLRVIVSPQKSTEAGGKPAFLKATLNQILKIHEEVMKTHPKTSFFFWGGGEGEI